MDSTIAAVATAPGRSAIAVIRISGPRAREVLASLGVKPGPARRAVRRRLSDVSGAPLDEALVLWFPGPASYTAEDLAEIHLHGGRYVVGTTLETIIAAGARLAEPGEFTRRAFEAGKLDLAQAEAIADLIEADTTAQARQALAQLGGAISERQRQWRQRVVAALAQLEALVDFPDEDIEAPVDAVRQDLAALAQTLLAGAGDLARGRAIREGWRVAVIGAPNAGKSSLFNRLAGRDAAIVGVSPGTTRDIIEAHLDLDGYRVLLADMAGLRATEDAVEAEGVRRGRAWALTADLRIWVVDGADPAQPDVAAELVRPGDLLVLNKADLSVSAAGRTAAAEGSARGLEVVQASQLPHAGDVVGPVVRRRVVEALGGGEFPSATRLRHAAALRAAAERLEAAVAVEAPELAAEEVRLAARALQSLTGAIRAEDVLDVVFSSFCIGK